eukprot:7724008-Pyramimonas_sp.AAC.1
MFPRSGSPGALRAHLEQFGRLLGRLEANSLGRLRALLDHLGAIRMARAARRSLGERERCSINL